MNRSSLHVRLSAAAAISIICALSLSGFFLMLLFERHVLRRVDKELSVYVKQLASALEIDPNGKPSLAIHLAEPRFQRPLSGLYWQIESQNAIVLRSRSLWDQSLNLPPFNAKDRIPLRHEIEGPDKERLIVRARTIFLETPEGDRAFRLAAAIDRNEVISARTNFTRELVFALGLLALFLLLAAWLQIFFGLRPLKQIRQRINDVRTGLAARLEGRYPEEVQLLVDEVNALLSANDKAIARARDSAADLAHGLKTPLAVLQAESRTLTERQQTESADEIAAQVEQMRTRIEHHLAIVRMRGSKGGKAGSTEAASGFEKIKKAMIYMPRGQDIKWQMDVPAGLNVAIDSQDFFEVFGNLLDNARKWASGVVIIRGQETKDAVVLTIIDDGPGVPDELIAEIQKRGRRLDEQKTGAGLGLSIAKKVLEAYEAKLSIKNIKDGGVRVSVTIPKSTVSTGS